MTLKFFKQLHVTFVATRNNMKTSGASMKLLVAIALLGVALASIPSQGSAQVRQQRAQNRIKENRSERLTHDGLALMQQGKTRAALMKFEEAVKLDAQNAKAYSAAAALYFKEGKFERAQQYAGIALRLQPDNARAHFVLAQLLLRERKALAAYDHLYKAMRYAPDQSDGAEARRLVARLRKENSNLFQPSSSPFVPPSTAPAPATPVIVGEKPLLAVFAFNESRTDSAEENLGRTLSEMLITSLINRGTYRIVEREQLHRVFQEQALGQSGALESETAVAVGNILGVQAVVVGTLSQPAGSFEADARILNVRTGEAVVACSARGNSAEQLRQMAENLSMAMATSVLQVQNAVQTDSADASESGQ